MATLNETWRRLEEIYGIPYWVSEIGLKKQGKFNTSEEELKKETMDFIKAVGRSGKDLESVPGKFREKIYQIEKQEADRTPWNTRKEDINVFVYG